jgi:autotransporter-associated beta strand protein
VNTALKLVLSLIGGLLGFNTTNAQTWIKPTNDFWSNANAWNPPGAPVSGSSTSLIFHAGSADSYQATNDLGNPFQLNSLTFDTISRSNTTVTSATSHQIEFTGINPLLGVGSSTGNSILNAATGTTINLNATSGVVAITGTGPGNLTINAPLGSTTGQGLRINTATPGLDVQGIVLTAANTFSGGVFLDSGNLNVANNSALGSGSLVANGGVLQTSSSSLTIPNSIVTNSALNVRISGGSDLTLGGVISGAGGLNVLDRRFGASVVVTADNTFTGPIFLNSFNTVFGYLAGALAVNGTGRIASAGDITIGSGGLLRVADSNNSAVIRLNAASNLSLNGGTFNYVGGTVSHTESLNQLVIDGGHNSIDIAANAAAASAVTFLGINRTSANRGTVLFSGSGLGNSPGNGVGNIFFTNAPGLTGGGGGAGSNTISILPYAVGANTSGGTANSLVTYDANGIRPLNTSTEYALDFTGGPTTNVRLTAATDINSSTLTTVNSLVVASGSLTNSQGGALRLTSGALLHAGGTISANLDFGNSEAIITTPTAAVTINGTISGSNGLTKSGSQMLTLSGNNTYSGQTTINSGVLSFSSAANLGATTQIVAGGPNLSFGSLEPPGLNYTGANPLSLTQNINVVSGQLNLQAPNSTSSITLAGQISGKGGVVVNGGSVTLTDNANNYEGGTHVGSGTLHFSNDAQLGSGAVDIGGGAGTGLVLEGNWVTSRRVAILDSAAINTNGYDAVLNGLLSGNIELSKTGAGTLSLTSRSPFNSTIGVTNGTFTLKDQGTIQASAFNVGPQGRVVLDNTSTVVNDRVFDQANLLFGGEIQILGNASANVSEKIAGTIFEGTSGNAALTLTAAGSTHNILTAGNMVRSPGNMILFRGDNLAGNSGAFTRIVFQSTIPFQNGIILGALYGATSTSNGDSFATYDSTVDAFGQIGVKGISYTQINGDIRNPSNAGSTPTTANFLVQDGTSNNVTPSTSNTINSLTLQGTNPTVNVGGGPNPTLNLTSGQILVKSGSTGAQITGGSLAFGSTTAMIWTNSDLAISSTITGTGGLTKAGLANLTLSGAQPYTGDTNIYNGTLILNGSLASTLVNVSFGATLAGSGTLAGSAAINGTLSPGSSPGSLSMSRLIFNSGSNFFIELQGTSPGTGYDQVVLTSNTSTYQMAANVSLTGTHLNGFVAPFLSSYVIVDNVNPTANSGVGTFNNLPDGAVFDLDGQAFEIRYNVGTYTVDATNGLQVTSPGGKIVIAAVPEPATYFLGAATALGLGAFWYSRRRVFKNQIAQDIDLEERVDAV